MTKFRPFLRCAGLAALCLVPQTVPALENIGFAVRAPSPEQARDLQSVITNSSALTSAEAEDRTDPASLIGAALSDYGNFLDALYSEGYYSGVVSITLDGQEAADIRLLDLPDQIDQIQIRIETGPRFTFSQTDIDPVPGSLDLPESFRPGEIARSGAVSSAVDATLEAWQERGRAKVRVASDSAVANHVEETLAVDVEIATGPTVTLGDLILTSESSVRAEAIRRIAGFPTGERFSPQRIDTVTRRLRETGAFSAVVLTQEEEIGPDQVMDMYLETADRAPRRIGFGAELSTQEGLGLTAFWLHRNFFGGAERLRLDAGVSDIGASDSGMDYNLGARLEIPAIYGADTDGFLRGLIAREDEPSYLSNRVELGFGATRQLTDALMVELGLGLLYADTEDDLGEREFFLLTFPASVEYDLRSNELNPRQGYYFTASATPYLGLDGSQSGARLNGDARLYLGWGDDDPNVLAARLQVGSIVGSDIEETPPDFLFFSGGGGTVRGQPYQSLNVDLGDGDEIGGRSFLGASLEYRRDITDAFGIVAFYDWGYIGSDSFYDEADGESHAGAGLGIRYQTAIGPIRFDVATPTSGETGEGIQYYIGIGQAF